MPTVGDLGWCKVGEPAFEGCLGEIKGDGGAEVIQDDVLDLTEGELGNVSQVDGIGEPPAGLSAPPCGWGVKGFKAEVEKGAERPH